MRLDKLRLRGWRGIKAGLNRDEIEIDFSKLSGLVAISGENGSGKTTCMDCLHPFRVMPSRKASLFRQTYLRDSFKDLSFWYEGKHYRTLVKIDAQSEKSEAFVWKDGISQVDGKVTNYDKYIIDLLGSTNLFFNSIFCAQNSKKINDLPTGQLKGLFSEFLQLDKLNEWQATSKQCISVIGPITSRIGKEIEALKSRIDRSADVDKKLAEAEKQGGLLNEDMEQATKTIDGLKNDYEIIKDAIAIDMVKKSYLKEQEKNLVRLNADRDKEFEKTESELNRLRIKLRETNDKLTEYDMLLKDKDKITEAWNQEAEVTEKLDIVSNDLEQRKKELDAVDNEINETTKTIDEQRRIIDAGKKDPEIARLEAEIGGKREKAVDLEKRDPGCQSKVCSFIIGALKAQDELPVLEKELGEKIDNRRNDDQKCGDAIEKHSTMLSVTKSNRNIFVKKEKALKDEKKALGDKLREIRLLSMKKPDIAVAISKKDDIEKKKDEITVEGIRIKDNRDKAIFVIDIDIKELKKEIANIESAIDNTINEKKEKIDQSIKSTLTIIQDIDTKIADVKENMAVLKQAQIEKRTAVKELEVRKSEYDKYVHEQSEWIYLRNSCSKDGIQALEIDSVAPMISSNSNELLNMSFGPSYSVKLRTQTDEGKETLDIIIIGENGEEILLDNMSGGEKCWLLMCIRLAMTLISKEKSGKNFLTGFSDETDGSLDVNRAIDFMHMYRAFMKLGGFETFFFISHRPECISLADHVIQFGDGRITID